VEQQQAPCANRINNKRRASQMTWSTAAARDVIVVIDEVEDASPVGAETGSVSPDKMRTRVAGIGALLQLFDTLDNLEYHPLSLPHIAGVGAPD